MSEDQQRLEKIYLEQKLTESNLSLLRQQIEFVDAVLANYRTGLEVLTEMESKREDEEVLMNVGGNIFVLAKLVNPGVVTRSIGSGVRIDQSITDAKTGVKEAISRLESQRDALNKEYEKMAAHAANLNALLQQVASRMQKQGA